ncbi:MAG: HAD-IC family P-type ATPase, partial [Proteobacteria bacterium]|nr:HAD-IC family P-type ATPase [Pseudomonadota bacterium]
YVPIVHCLAGAGLLFWLAKTGDWHRAVSVGVAVLVITCPCALGLAVPMVHVMAARRLFERRIMVRDGSAIERLAEADTVAFDKTGTLTCGVSLASDARLPEDRVLAIAAALGRHSNHPHARCLAATAPGRDGPLASGLAEEPGQGIEGWIEGRRYRLGRAAWALAPAAAEQDGTLLASDDGLLAAFSFEEKLRPGAQAAVGALRAAGLELAILSGDGASAVAPIARTLAIPTFESALLPSGKVDWLRGRAMQGHKVLMVGDGLNDAPALTAAHVSMAPATAADIGRQSADFVFLGDDLAAVPFAHDLARRAGRLVNQNFALAVAYNLVALPVAFLGQVTPLIAALAMSASSLTVVVNALRLRGRRES